MAQIVKGTIGDQPVELNNAATETTLAAMLALAKKDSATLAEMAKKAGVDAKSIEKATKAMEAQSKAGSDAGAGLAKTGSSASLLGGFLMDMGQSVMATIGNLGKFGDELLEGKARASDLFKAFKDLPLGLGLLATLFEKVMKYQEKNLDIYQQISKVGVGLTGSLSNLRTSAASVYLSLDEYAEVLTKNSDVMNRLGGSATLGHKNFDAVNKSLMQGKLGTELLNLGYSFKDVNNMLGNYLRVSNDGMKVGRDVSKEQERLANSAALYGKELDFMARLTGESREALQAKMEQEAMEASWQLKMADMTDEQKEKAQIALMKAQQLGGKGAVDALKASIMGFAAPFSEQGRMFVSTMRDGTKAVEGMAKTVMDGSKATDASKKMNKLFADGMAGNIKDIKSLKNVIFAMGQGGTESSEGLMEVVKAANAFKAQGMEESKAIQKAMEETQKKADADKAAAAGAVATEKAMKALSNMVNTALAPVMDLLAKYGNELVASFAKWVKNTDFDKLGQSIKSLMEATVNYTKYLFDPAGRQKILNDIKDLFREILIELKLALAPFYNQSDAAKERRKMELNDRILKSKADEAMKLEEYQSLMKRIQDGAIYDKLKAKADEQEAEIKKLESNKNLTDQEKDYLKRLKEARDENVKRYKAAEEYKDPKARESAQKQADAMYQDYQALHQQTVKAVADFNSALKQGFAPEKPVTQPGQPGYGRGRGSRASGSIGTTGNLIENFGKGTDMTLHGKESVLTETQLTNLAKGSMDTGSAQAQEKLANAVLALNKQQAMTNVILDRIAENTRRAAENQGRWGNAFTRV